MNKPGYPKKKEEHDYDHDCNGFCYGCHTQGNNQAIDEFSAEIRRRCDLGTIEKILHSELHTPAMARAICKHFKEGLDNGD